jgi:guanyl-specific ribonuclease Sa
VYIAAHSRLRQADVAEIRLGQTIVLLLRPGCAWPVELARQRLDARRIDSVLHGLRQRPLAVAQLRSFWHCHHLAGRQLTDEALLVEFATAIKRHRIEALVLPLRHGAVSSVPAAATGEAGGGPARSPVSATPARTTVGRQPPVPVAQWDIRRRLAYVLPKAAEDVPGEALRSIILGLATPEGLAALVLVVGLEVASHAAGGVGFFADAALVAVLWAMCGVSAFYAMIAFRDCLTHTIEARTDRDLDVAARDLAHAAVLLGSAALTFLGGWVKAKTAAGRVGGAGAGEASSASAGASESRVQGARARTVRQADERPVMEPATSVVPQRARAVADIVRQTGQSMPGYKGGRAFRNDARGGGQQLPSTDAVGNGISYREWDVNPLRPGFDRGPERVVTGSDGSAYYTADHYQTFVPIE